jgi:tetratricopeptide (TPR) repeat protein
MSDPILLARAIRELGRYALVAISGRSISVHRLVQALLRDELDKNEQDRYRSDVHAILAAAAPSDPSDDRQWARYRELLPHVTSEATGVAQSRDPKVREFVLNTIRYMYLSDDVASFIELADNCIAQWTADSGADSPAVITAKRHYGDVLRQLGRYSDAYELVAETLNVANKTLGESDSLTLAIRNAFGGDLRARGEFAEALKFDDATLALHEGALGEEDPQTLRVLTNLGNDYGLNAKYREAEESCRRAHILRSQASSEVSATEVLISWYTLAWTVRMQGKYAEARDVGEEAWDYGNERLGADHFATLRTAVGLSIAQRRIAPARQEAMRIAVESYDRARKRFGENHPDAMAAAINLANAQRTNGLIDEALALAEETVSRYPNIYGSDHPYNYGCAGNLALMQRVSGNYAEALRVNEFALEGLDRRLTRDHIYSLTVAINLASDLALLNEHSRARTLGEDTLPRVIKIVGKDHPLALACAANLALDLRNDGAESDAELLHADTMSRYQTTLGLSHPDAIAAKEGMRLDFDFDPPPI